MEIGWAYFLKEDYDSAKKYLDDSLKLKSDYLNNYRMARVYFKINDYDTGFNYLIKSMRINQNFSENYSYLGDYFCAKNNFTKAKQSYRKAHYLNNADEVAGKKLVEILIKSKDDTVEAIDVCNTIIKNNLRCLWAWKHLSYLYYIMVIHNIYIYLFIFLFIYIFIYIYIYLFIYIFIYLFIYLFIY